MQDTRKVILDDPSSLAKIEQRVDDYRLANIGSSLYIIG